MADISSAATMVNYYTDHPPQIRGRTVYAQFSNHEQLKTEQSSQVRNVLTYITQGSHSDWKIWENGKAFSSQW